MRSFTSPPIRPIEFASPGGEPSDIALDKKQFAKLISVRHAVDAPPKLLVSSRLALWLAADVAMMTDAMQRVVAWPDILYGDNRLSRRRYADRRTGTTYARSARDQRSPGGPIQRTVRLPRDHAAGNDRRSKRFDRLPVFLNRLSTKTAVGEDKFSTTTDRRAAKQMAI